MLSEKIVSMTNEQIKKELESAYLYLEIANFYEENGLSGFANWFLVQVREEQDHAMILYRYLHDNNAQVVLYPIEPIDFKSEDYIYPLEKSLNHEKYVTASINSIYKQAEKEEDFRTTNFLGWFIKEQQEEEVNAQKLLTDFALYCPSCSCDTNDDFNCDNSQSDDGNYSCNCHCSCNLMQLDKKLSSRKYESLSLED